MAIFTLAEVNEQIELYKDALKALSTNQSYSRGGLTISRVQLPEIRATLEWLTTERILLLADTSADPTILSGRPYR